VWHIEIVSGQLFAICVVVGLGTLNYFGVRFGGAVQVVTTVVKVACIVAIIVFGILAAEANPANLSSSVVAVGGVVGFFGAMVGALWAYDGWNNVTMVASEVKNPQRNLPLALVAGTAAVMVLYIGANIAYFLVLSAEEVAASPRVAAAAMGKVFGLRGAQAVSLAAMISIFAAINGSILAGARVPFAMARDGLMIPGIARIHPRYATPHASIILLTLWACVLVLSGRYSELFSFVIFGSWILYAMATASVMVLRHRRPDLARPYRTVGYPLMPVLFVLVALCLLTNTLIDSPVRSIAGLGLILLGVPFYFYWKRRN
jgi:APA family basic amino acid/polyamine antiporter